MPRGRKHTVAPSQTGLLDITAKLRTGPCVPALREAVKAWAKPLGRFGRPGTFVV